ncbi:MAG TPA: 6,7-dimethyl-8-ribityllumazine synthase [bacterium]|jgi:6,7-dimethyl-8-ribityllumazine synthase|nr:6,7-dimethyl-8-ribityllumazine synthase [bacterium]
MGMARPSSKEGLELKPGSARGMNIRVVVAAFNRVYTARLLRSARARLKALGAPKARVDWCAGALELPLAARWAVQDASVDAVLALGCVIRGDTSHYDLVCRGALDGLQRVGLDSGVPVLFGVITVENEEQARVRCDGGPHDAGRHAAEAAVGMALLRRRAAGKGGR